MSTRGIGRGLAAILPETGARRPRLPRAADGDGSPEPGPAAKALRSRVDLDPGGVDRRGGNDPADPRPADARWPLRADRRRAPLARGPRGGARDGAGAHPRRRRRHADADRADRKRRARGPESGRRGARLRCARRGSRAHERGARPPSRPLARVDLEPRAPARPPGRRSRLPLGGQAHRRVTAARS